MPKIIDDLRATLLANSRRILAEQGYDGLTLRLVAKESGVAVGTVYNYFASKDMLVANVMLADWLAALAGMQQAAAAAADPLQGLRAVYDGILGFEAQYTDAWAQYSARANAAPMLAQRHNQLIGQLVDVIEPLLARFGCVFDPVLPAFLASTLLHEAGQPDMTFDRLVPVFQKLLA